MTRRDLQKDTPGANRAPAARGTPALREFAAKAWLEILELDRHIEDGDDFFRLGGHSLLAFRTMFKLQDDLATTLPIQTLFERPLFGEFVKALESALTVVDEPLGGPAVTDAADAPLTPFQSPCWDGERRQSVATWSPAIRAFELEGPLDMTVLEGAIRVLASRCEVLRTTFAQRESQPMQYVVDSLPRLRRVQLDTRGDSHGDALRRLCEQERQRPWNLEREGPIRALLSHVEQQHYLLCLCFHRALLDRASISTICEEISSLYTQLSEGGASEDDLRDAPRQSTGRFIDYARWSRSEEAQTMQADARSYWGQRLEGLQPVEFPGPSPADLVEVELSVPGVQCARLRAAARRGQVSLRTVFVAAFVEWLRCVDPTRDAVLLLEAENRSWPGTEGSLGAFDHLVPLRFAPGSTGASRESLSETEAVIAEARRHQGLPLAEMLAAAGIAHRPCVMFPFALQYSEREPDTLALGTVRCRALLCGDGGDEVQGVSVTFNRSSQGLAGAWRASTQLLASDDAAVEASAEYLRVLTTMVDDDARPRVAPG